MRRFGRFELRQLLSKSGRSMLWLVLDTRSAQELMICMPRQAPSDPLALEHWLKSAKAGSRISHPNLAHAVEVGQVEHWPYIAYDRALGETLDERLARVDAVLPIDAASLICQYLEGLAFAHESGHVHRDVQFASLIINEANQVRVLGLEVAQDMAVSSAEFNTVSRHAMRQAAEDDVLCTGLMLHRILSGRAVLDRQDLQQVVQQMQPSGQELVRLGWETPHPIPDPLRAICNRATDRQPRQRYHLARSFLRALDGWRTASAYDEGGPVALLIERIQRVGHLPSFSSSAQRVAQFTRLEREHASELSGLVLKDMALSFEVLRRVNRALRRNAAVSEGPILNMQRAIAMLGLDGIQAAARSLRAWPGPLSEVQAGMLESLMKRVRRAGQIAQALRPAGYDAEVVYLITLMQNLGRLLLQYHFPDDAQQIRQLMQAPEPTEDNPNPQGMTEQSAAFAVLGCDLDAMGAAVARLWSLGEESVYMMRRHAGEVPVRAVNSDADLLRLTCSLANELVEAEALHLARLQPGIERATRRYARALGIGLREVHAALHPEAGKRADQAAPGRENSPEDMASAAPPPRELLTGAPAASPLRARLGARTQGVEDVPRKGAPG